MTKVNAPGGGARDEPTGWPGFSLRKETEAAHETSNPLVLDYTLKLQEYLRLPRRRRRAMARSAGQVRRRLVADGGMILAEFSS